MKKRIASIELLRILAMMMVVMLHYLSKGELLTSLTEEFDASSYIAWLLEAFSIVAVNVYMLISGYFLVDSGFKLKRLVQLVCQVLFYSLLIPPVLLAAGILRPEQVTVYRLLQYALPGQMAHYWFITAYLIMYLLSPVLAAGARALSQKQLRNTIVLLLLFFSVSKSVLPVQLEVDNLGYDGLWFICVFLTAAYMRLYGIPFLQKGRRAALYYLGSCALIYGLTLGVRLFYLKTGRLGHFIHAPYDYNHILNLFAAISLFYTFSQWKLSGEKFIGKVILRVAPYTLGVYLLHEHVELRTLWPRWLGAGTQSSPWALAPRAICSVLAVFAVGILVDMARGALFSLIEKIGRSTK
ncbi:MAG: acyltransferase family protein [Lachnospiraceae bacterium]|nr:acyltransferase family protein [Lachnospiraceae bacterium]